MAKRVPGLLAGGFGLLVTLGLGVGLTGLWWVNATAPVGDRPKSVTIQVPEGASADSIGQQLQQAGLIHSVAAWKIWARLALLQNGQGSFQTGTYELSPHQSLDTIAKTIWTGQVKQASFTIPEGWSIQEMGAYFEKEGWFAAADFIAEAQHIPRDRFTWLPPDLPLLEGFLFPDTYQLPIDQKTPKAVLTTMLQHFENNALPLYQQRSDKQDLSLKDWVTLSSIIEKEAVVPTERGVISGVFWNRLKLGMTLGSDPTVEYGLGIRQTADQPLTFSQVRQPSPYNTYINPGLPPTPIASPGLASLKAALAPEQTPYLYFVARYDGTHVFSKTLAEHERAQALIWKQRDTEAAKTGQT